MRWWPRGVPMPKPRYAPRQRFYTVTLDCGHKTVLARLVQLGEELGCTRPHTNNRRERVTMIERYSLTG